jgi:protein ImuA
MPVSSAEGFEEPRARELRALRQAIQGIEKKTVTLESPAAPFSFGIADIDQALGGGLAPSALHEIAAVNETQIAVATGFVCAIAAHCARTKAVLWVAEEMSVLESGYPYGPGLDEAGLSPERLVIVSAMRSHDVLWTMEEALRCRAIGAVIGEIRTSNALDDVAGRRLALACAERSALALLLRPSPDNRPLPATTRWIVAASSSTPIRYGIGPPGLHIRLVRNRNGRLGSWLVEWNRVEQRFGLPAAHPESVAAPALDGSAAQAVA